ncbi:MAG: ATP-binding protein [Pirellulaceae bacterium]
MIRLPFGRRVFAAFAGLAILGGIGLILIARGNQAGIERQATLDRLSAIANLVGHDLAEFLQESSAENRLQELVEARAHATNTHITMVNEDGRVLADSQQNPRRMSNPLMDPEFQQAASEGRGVTQLREENSGDMQWFVAVPVTREAATIGYVRVGSSRITLESSRFWTQWAVAGFVLLVIGIGYRFGRSLDQQLRMPLQRLTLACQQVSQSTTAVDGWPMAQDDIGDLSREFLEMCRAVHTRESKLRDQNNRVETVLGSMVEGVLAVDAHQVVLLANNAVRTLLDIRVAQVVGRPLLEVTRNRSLDESFTRAIDSPEPISAEIEVVGPSRRLLNLQANRLPGTPSPGVVMVLHDVTDLQRLENLRREFVANVSHELKTPLAAIRAYAETLQLGAVNDVENRDYFLRQITDQSDRLHELILDMLQIARMEAGQEVFEITDVDVAMVVEKCMDAQRDPAIAKDISLTCQPSDLPLAVRADEEGLRTILGNLIDNAIKYSSAGGAVIVAWRQIDERVEISVEDRGIGIPAQALERIFERFYRVDKARSREMGGTGLGLSIVKHLTQSFGGDVGVDSEVDRGTRFHVSLPAAKKLP